MASGKEAKITERAPTNANSQQVERGVNGDLSISLNRSQWMNIFVSLGIATGSTAHGITSRSAAAERDYQHLFELNGLTHHIGTCLGFETQITSSTESPPGRALAAAAGG